MNKYKFPTSTSYLSEARLYALDSINHTYDYDGFENGCENKKLSRITVGNCCQLWLAEFCSLNEIDHKKDISSPYKADRQDLYIKGYSIDCKASIRSDLDLQVSPHILKQDNIDYYFFCETDNKLSFIKPLGFISRTDYMDKSTKVKRGDKLPGSNLTQFFDESYFLHASELIGFEDGISKFKEWKKRAA